MKETYLRYLDALSFLLEPGTTRGTMLSRLLRSVFSEVIKAIADDKVLITNCASTINRYVTQEEAYSPWFLRIPYKRLRRYGRSEDLESPLGYIIQSMSFPQDDSENLKIYAPCAFSIPERVLNYGPEISSIYSYNVHRDLFASKRMEQKDVYSLHWKAWETYKSSWRTAAHAKARATLYATSSYIKSRRLIWTMLSSSQHFYEEAIKFYTHGRSGDLYIGSSSPGIIIPEEFYGDSIYYPGIARDVRPCHIFDVKGQRDSLVNLRWILQEAIHSGTSVGNPFRIPYFTMGPGGHATPQVHESQKGRARPNYTIFEDQAMKTLRENRQRWARNGKGAEYDNDIAALYTFFAEKLNIRWLKGKKEDYAHNRFPLASDNGFWYFAERDPKLSKITKGSLVNIYLLRKFISRASGEGAALLTGIAGMALGDSVFGLLVGLLPPLAVGTIQRRYPQLTGKPDALEIIKGQGLKSATSKSFAEVMKRVTAP